MQAKWYASQITALCMKGSLPSRTRYERAHLSNTGEGLRKGEGWDGYLAAPANYGSVTEAKRVAADAQS
eukprot:1140320-Pelagomonas_calceolata.AAC.7